MTAARLPYPSSAAVGESGARKIGTKRLRGEPRLPELLADPILHLMMQSDGVSASALEGLIAQARSNLRAEEAAL